MKRSSSRWITLLCVAACATVLSIAGLGAEQLPTRARSADGRLNVWCQCHNSGQLTKVALDSNLDGRSDVEEYYDLHGALVRRESDRNFNGQVDLVEEFDPVTHEHARSVVDLDFDGTADLLVLFSNGQPVFSEQAHTVAGTRGRRNETGEPYLQLVRNDGPGRLAPLADPFRTETNIRSAIAVASSDECVGVSATGGPPCSRVEVVRPVSSPVRLFASDVSLSAPAFFFARAPRGPPHS